ncbi:TorD/DmsD family molecular chaperone [Archaeoglobus veneficus]|uniref:Anaerobic dehydrogenase-like protein n=1 Tax=Archaeoglobus veneficus (strain DSM 11195 / SNP6) TaxID=693661 RepID=F2KRH3_ARCVS|nr:molecular chaperone TorD family protein [Archaeoglobus veneficus]AEA46738.1 anaerobic dehydrogenase-like protein [Archaeoglobus veneficus SNP6]
MSDIESIIKGRMAMYSFLSSVLLDAPPKEFLRDLMKCEVVFPVHPIIDEGAKILTDMASKFENVEDFEIFVRQEYTAVFVGPFGETVSPYQSTYEGDSPYREVTARIKRKYLEMGYIPQVSEPADHIGVELSFMAESCRAMLESGKKEDRIREMRNQMKFLKEELLTWIFNFCNALENNENARFYKGISKILRGFMEMEKRAVDELYALLR